METKKEKSEEGSEVKISTNNLMAVFLAIMFLVGAIQTFQLLELSSKISQQETDMISLKANIVSTPTGVVTAVASPNTQSSSSVPSNLQNLPDMVGGC